MGKRIERFDKYMTFKGLNDNKVTKDLSLSIGTLGKSRKENRDISDRNVELILKFYNDLNGVWLLTGEGSMLKEKVKDSSTYVIQEEEPVEYLNYKIKFIEEPKNTENLCPVYEDVVTFGGINGYGADMSGVEYPSSYIEDPKGYLRGATACVLHRGDSMKEYPNGIYLAVKRLHELDTRFLIPGEAYMIETDEYRVTKRIRLNDDDTITLHSTNEECYANGKLIHQPFEVALSDIRGLYRVLRYGITKYGEVVEFK